MLHYSKYNVEFQDGNDFVIINLFTGSIIKLPNDKFVDLNNELALFNKEELQQLLEMGILFNGEEFDFVQQKRLENFQNQKDEKFHITVLTTLDCNARCYYCYEKGVTKSSMTPQTARQVVEFIKNNYDGKIVSFSWFGGEPLYNHTIIDIICSELQKLNISYESHMITNAYLVYEHFDKIINFWNVKRLQITLDGIGVEYNKIKNYIYGKSIDAFNVIIDNIERLLSYNIRVVLRVNFNPMNIKAAQETIEFVFQRFGNNSNLRVYGAWLTGDKIPSPQDYIGDSHPLLEIYRTLLNCGYIQDIEDLGIATKLLNCSVYRNKWYVVNIDGNLYKCQHAIVDGACEAIGDIYDGVINIPTLNKWQGLSYPMEECKKCKCLPICQGGCKSKVLKADRDICLPFKNCIKEALQLFYKKIYKGEKL